MPQSVNVEHLAFLRHLDMSAQQKHESISGPVLPSPLRPDSQFVKTAIDEMKYWPNKTFSEMVHYIFLLLRNNLRRTQQCYFYY